jgi:hypothetical protein
LFLRFYVNTTNTSKISQMDLFIQRYMYIDSIKAKIFLHQKGKGGNCLNKCTLAPSVQGCAPTDVVNGFP